MSQTDPQISKRSGSGSARTFRAETAIAVAPDTDIIGEGLVDSLGTFKLIAFVEEAFAVTIERDEVLLETWRPRLREELSVA
jgi:hypothetical protein